MTSVHRGLSRRALFTAAAGAAGAGVLGAGLAGAASAAPSGASAPAAGAAAGRKASGVDYPAAHWVPASTSNYTKSNRPSTYPIELVVIHVTQETFDDTITLFQDPSHAACAHYVTRSADGYIDQMVREKDIAWHAGNWDYNTRSIGIEHEGWVDDPSWFTDAMYSASAKLTRSICDRYGIAMDRDHIIGHVEVPGTDHTDPGPYWDWDKYMALVRA
jgi:N-acetyl-anhydromuramyl-L-alanine amidase AmpD